jgi:pterin-4a-carbinolamine dehydratase
MWLFSQEVKQLGQEADHHPPQKTAVVKKEFTYITITTHAFMTCTGATYFLCAVIREILILSDNYYPSLPTGVSQSMRVVG